MKRPSRIIYGWFDQKAREFRISFYPADAPVRPSVAVQTKSDVLAIVARKRATIYWWPPLPSDEVIGHAAQ